MANMEYWGDEKCDITLCQNRSISMNSALSIVQLAHIALLADIMPITVILKPKLNRKTSATKATEQSSIQIYFTMVVAQNV